MKLWFKIFPEDLRIKAFNRGWWFYIAVTILGLIVFTIYGNTLVPEKKLTYIMVTSIVELIILRVYKFYMISIRDDYKYFNELPCYLCNQPTILCIIAALTNNSHLMSFCIVMGTGGSLLAMLFPSRILENQTFYCIRTFGFLRLSRFTDHNQFKLPDPALIQTRYQRYFLEHDDALWLRNIRSYPQRFPDQNRT